MGKIKIKMKDFALNCFFDGKFFTDGNFAILGEDITTDSDLVNKYLYEKTSFCYNVLTKEVDTKSQTPDVQNVLNGYTSRPDIKHQDTKLLYCCGKENKKDIILNLYVTEKNEVIGFNSYYTKLFDDYSHCLKTHYNFNNEKTHVLCFKNKSNEVVGLVMPYAERNVSKVSKYISYAE